MIMGSDHPSLHIEEFSLGVDDVLIRGETMRPGGQKRLPVLIICHGIPQHKQGPWARNEGYRSLARYFAKKGFLSIIFNFRGTGYSGGSFDLWGWRRDLEAVLDMVREEETICDEEQISLLGFSGGAATACITAAGRPESVNVILAACPADFDFLFDKQSAAELLEEAASIGIMRQGDMPQNPEKWCEEQKKFRPVDYIARISPRPLLLIHGLRDELVLPEHAHSLYAAAREQKELIFLPEAPHQLRTLPEVWETCYCWLMEQFSRT